MSYRATTTWLPAITLAVAAMATSAQAADCTETLLREMHQDLQGVLSARLSQEV